jgi:flagellar hook protein FlgE
MQAGATFLNLQEGEAQATGNDLDAMIDGAGLFVLRQGAKLVYARAGQFELNQDGVLADRASGARVAAMAPGGGLTDISISGLRFSPAQATSTVTLSGNLSASDSQHVIDSLTVYDGNGSAEQLKLTFDNIDATTHAWKVTVAQSDGTTVGTGEIRFSGGSPQAGFDTVRVNAPGAFGPLAFALDFSHDVTNVDEGADSSLQVQTADGRATGSITKTSFDADGNFVATYSNGQTETHGRLALAWVDSPDQIEQLGGNLFGFRQGVVPTYGVANGDGFGAIRAGSLEMSNVDLAKQFSELIVTQRGYQACSQAITTANEMLQMLMDLRGKR